MSDTDHFCRSKKHANNPWGNRGRKKCGNCRSRKRSVCSTINFISMINGVKLQCTFDIETNPCYFCATHGVRCGPKVFAEKAKYYRSKRLDDGRTSNLAQSNSAAEDEFKSSQKAASSEHFAQYNIPAQSHVFVVETS